MEEEFRNKTLRFTNNNFVGSNKAKDNNLEQWGESSAAKRTSQDDEEEKFFEESIEEEISCH